MSDFLFRPDWSSPLSLSLSFRTARAGSMYGYQQRSILRKEPRFQIEFDIVVRYQSDIFYTLRDLSSTIYVPNWCLPRDISVITNEADVTQWVDSTLDATATVGVSYSPTGSATCDASTSSGSVIYFSERTSESISAGDRVLIHGSNGEAQAFDVLDAQASCLVIDGVFSWTATPGKAYLYKMYQSVPQIRNSISETDDLVRLSLQFTQAQPYANVPSNAGLTTYCFDNSDWEVGGVPDCDFGSDADPTVPAPVSGAVIATWPASEGDDLSVGFGSTTTDFRGVLEAAFDINWEAIPASITAEWLAGVDCLWLRHTSSGARSLSSAEQSAIWDWIQSGGAYIVQTDGAITASDQNVFKSYMLGNNGVSNDLDFRLTTTNTSETVCRVETAHNPLTDGSGTYGTPGNFTLDVSTPYVGLAQMSAVDGRATQILDGNFNGSDTGAWIIDPGDIVSGSGAVMVCSFWFPGIDLNEAEDNGSPRNPGLGGSYDADEHDKLFKNFIDAYVPEAIIIP